MQTYTVELKRRIERLEIAYVQASANSAHKAAERARADAEEEPGEIHWLKDPCEDVGPAYVASVRES